MIRIDEFLNLISDKKVFELVKRTCSNELWQLINTLGDTVNTQTCGKSLIDFIGRILKICCNTEENIKFLSKLLEIYHLSDSPYLKLDIIYSFSQYFKNESDFKEGLNIQNFSQMPRDLKGLKLVNFQNSYQYMKKIEEIKTHILVLDEIVHSIKNPMKQDCM